MEIFYWLRSQLLFDVIREHQTLREGSIFNSCIFTSSTRLDTPAHVNPKDQVYLCTVNKVRSLGILTEPEWAPPETTFFGHGNRRGILMMSLCPRASTNLTALLLPTVPHRITYIRYYIPIIYLLVRIMTWPSITGYKQSSEIVSHK